MTVINKEKLKCVNPSSAPPSDTESLHIPSDSDSSFNESIAVVRRPPLRNCRIAYDSHTLTRKNCGKRKLQRLVNFTNLQVLNENEELDLQLVENYGSPFSRLTQNPNALQYWNEFIELSEEEQENVINNFKRAWSRLPLKRDNPIRRMLAKLKKKFKVKNNLPVEIEKVEMPLLNFFKSNKDAVYVFVPKSSLERLLLLIIAQYHNLNIISEMHDCDLHFQICVGEDWKPTEVEFCEIVQQKLQH